MNNFLKYGYLAITIFFTLVYMTNFIIALIRESKVLKTLKEKPNRIKAVVVEVKNTDKNIFLIVEFTSPTSLILFTHTFKFNPKNIDVADYPVGREVTLLYSDISGLKKVRKFPYFLEGQKINFESGPLVTNLLLVGFGLYATIALIYRYVSINAFASNIPFTNSQDAIYPNSLPTIIMVFIFCVLSTYIIESVFSPLRADNHNYLKINGVVAKARVVTYKFGRKKNRQGNRESLLTLEYYNNIGEKTTTNLNSFMYTEKQEEFIDILYDPLNSKNIVYLKQ